MKHRFTGLLWVGVSQSVSRCDVLILNEAFCRNIESCAPRFAQEIWPYDFRRASNDLIDLFVDNLRFAHAEAALFFDAMVEGVLWPVEVGTWFTGSPLHYLVVLLKSAARADLLLAIVARLELVACEETYSIVGDFRNAGGWRALSGISVSQVCRSLHF